MRAVAATSFARSMRKTALMVRSVSAAVMAADHTTSSSISKVRPRMANSVLVSGPFRYSLALVAVDGLADLVHHRPFFLGDFRTEIFRLEHLPDLDRLAFRTWRALCPFDGL